MRRLAGTARRGKGYALPVKRNKSGMKDGGIIIEDSGADLSCTATLSKKTSENT